MKVLTLIRHAKSSWKDPSLPDWDRPLNKRGRRDAPLMGERLAERGDYADLMISSSAVRAVATAEAIAEAIEYPLEEIVVDERLYGLGITVCIENLRTGPSSHPEDVAAWARASGAMITYDVGHAVSNPRVQSGELTPLDVLEMFADWLWHVHMYEREEDRHHPPRDMTVLGPIIDRLLTTECTWWTIELDEPAEALGTRALLLDYLGLEYGREAHQPARIPPSP